MPVLPGLCAAAPVLALSAADRTSTARSCGRSHRGGGAGDGSVIAIVALRAPSVASGAAGRRRSPRGAVIAGRRRRGRRRLVHAAGGHTPAGRRRAGRRLHRGIRVLHPARPRRVGVAAVSGLVAALVLALMAVRRPATSFRTRAFSVIIVAVLIPCPAAGGARHLRVLHELGSRPRRCTPIRLSTRLESSPRRSRSLSKTPGRSLPPSAPALAEPSSTSTASRPPEAPCWSSSGARRPASRCFRSGHLRSLERRVRDRSGKGPTAPERAEFVAWRVGPRRCGTTCRDGRARRSWTPTHRSVACSGSPSSALALIAVLGLLGAWLLSRSVVRPVRRLAEASGRLAEGEALRHRHPAGPA